ncbi:cell surface immobilization antigen (macronuclear) [Tetrahymena thermophila SB210]|uniref:Cell surface immobilization antigen n=1 Tax=Tetrahymena thermophila (strain SB210) TaxID=312017 RepID=Q23H95_TETTS|nr:cell surface immobilization antigen [Tetrahymena thermophila SB210]EAR95913.1 cell surface immobilization antigen [Tetrahymena thermophila SB210]|eukprot:XP_001016158.1 cell surface immobilization antigen [Tetrahymena thermophila SB210]
MNILKLSVALLLVGFIFAAQGNDVVCTGSGTSCSDKCPQLPGNLSWVTGSNNNKCAVNNCPNAADAAKLTGIVDLYCQSCPGTPNGSISAIFANSGNTACVASSASCHSSRPANSWTDADCLACIGPKFSVASSDKQSCTANANILIISVLMAISLIF